MQLKGRATAASPAFDAYDQIRKWNRLYGEGRHFPIRAVFSCRYWNPSGRWVKIQDPNPNERENPNVVLVELVLPALTGSVCLNGRMLTGADCFCLSNKTGVTGVGDRIDHCQIIQGEETIEIDFRFGQNSYVLFEGKGNLYARIRKDGRPYRYRGGRGSILYHLREPRLIEVSSAPIWF